MALFRRVKPPFSLKTMQKDSNCIAIQDPSAVWGVQDFLPRRNLLTYTEDFSNAAWTKGISTISGDKLQCVYQDNQHYVLQNYTLTTGVSYRQSVYAKQDEYSFVRLRNQSVGTKGAFFDLSTGSVGTVESGYSAFIESIGDGWYRCSIVFSAVTAGAMFFAIYAANADNVVSFTPDASGTYGIRIKNAQLTRADTLDQSYQKITDWTTEQYAWAAAKQVPWLRRNMLYDTELFSAWNKASFGGTGVAAVVTDNYGTAPDSTQTAARVQIDRGASNTTSDYSYLTRVASVSVVAGFTYSRSIWLKLTSGSTPVTIGLGDAGLQSNVTVTDTWTKFENSLVANGTARGLSLFVRGGTYATSQSADILCWHPSMGPGETAPEYQPILADWDATYTANAIAAGYPIALWQDSAGTKAVNADNQPIGACRDLKYGDYGANLVSNGTLDSDTTGWSNEGATSVSAETGELKIVASGSGQGAIQQMLLEVGKRYFITAQIRTVSGIAASVRITSANKGAFVYTGPDITSSTLTTHSFIWTPIQTNEWIYVRAGAAGTAYADNISIREIPGYTAIQATTANQPKWRLDANGKPYIERDLTNDSLPITLPTVLSDSQLGPELVTSLNFQSGWTLVNASASSASTFTTSNTGGAHKAIGMSVGKTYRIGIDYFGKDATSSLTLVNAAGSSTPIVLTVGTQVSGSMSAVFVAAVDALYLRLSVAGNITVSNISVREVTGTNVVYTAEGNVTLKDSGLILSGSYAPITPAADYGRIIMAADSRYDAKIIKYLDQKRGRAYSLGPELVTNGGFDSDTWWSKGGTITISGGMANFSSTPVGSGFNKTSVLTSGKLYSVTFTITALTSGGVYCYLGGTYGTSRTALGTYNQVVTCGSTDQTIAVLSSVAGSTLSVDNISVREVLL